jgi:hypothetical protein
MKTSSVPASVLAITGVWTAETNLALVEECRKAGVSLDEPAKVAEVWRRVKHHAWKSHDKKRAQAQRLRRMSKIAFSQLRHIEAVFPHTTRPMPKETA